MNTNNSSRIELIDALRGYALMGLFLVHMVEYYEVLWYSPPEVLHPITKWMFNLFGGKAYAMFGMLFGVSFYIIMQRNTERGVDFRLRFLWRLMLLLMLGYLHGLVYCGEVLQILAIAGLLLVPLWFAPSWLLLTISVALLLQVSAFGFMAWITTHPALYQHPFYVAVQKVVYPFYAHGNFAEVIAANAIGGTQAKWLFMLESGRFANIVGLSLLGFWLAKNEFFTNTQRFGKLYLRLLFCFAALAALCYHFTPALVKIFEDSRISDVWLEIIYM
ncbi:MAG TPA: heparan-alpha-glucosaminide N-acetyltransferase domain-containing protein [Steroidobacteraceae bacterium]|nr:heparan-alpha-glucosaminide N-acetyltransferase domain-containing protein [Steroidobacteraceae bacterium]